MSSGRKIVRCPETGVNITNTGKRAGESPSDFWPMPEEITTLQRIDYGSFCCLGMRGSQGIVKGIIFNDQAYPTPQPALRCCGVENAPRRGHDVFSLIQWDSLTGYIPFHGQVRRKGSGHDGNFRMTVAVRTQDPAGAEAPMRHFGLRHAFQVGGNGHVLPDTCFPPAWQPAFSHQSFMLTSARKVARTPLFQPRRTQPSLDTNQSHSPSIS